jgi:hypothetical protein
MRSDTLELLAGLAALFAPLVLAWWLVARGARREQRGKIPEAPHKHQEDADAHQLRGLPGRQKARRSRHH